MHATPGTRLRCGFTTGTAAAAAVKAALVYLLSGKTPDTVRIELPTGDELPITVYTCRRSADGAAVCSVIKDAGDDPDVTHGAEIGARVRFRPGASRSRVEIEGGPGVGRVTKPGLETPPGQAAITSGPRRMIGRAALDALAQYGACGTVLVEIFVPRGEALARRTLNERLGIVGGISILGTTGIVRPLSHDAYVATIEAALSVARATGGTQVVLTTGRRSERFAQNLWPDMPAEGFVQIGDFFARAMEITAAKGFSQANLAVFFGKAVKMAQGIAHTHARSARLTMEQLSRWALKITGGESVARRVAQANTARQVFDMVKDDHWPLVAMVGDEMLRAAASFAGNKVNIHGVVFGFDGAVAYEGFRPSCQRDEKNGCSQ